MNFTKHQVAAGEVDAVGFNSDFGTLRIWFADQSVADYGDVTAKDYQKLLDTGVSVDEFITSNRLRQELEIWGVRF